MVAPHISRTKLITVNTFGALGYASIALQWMWALLLYAPFLLTDSVQDMLLPQRQPPEEITRVAAAPEPSLVMIALMLIITTLMIAVVIYVALKAPSVVGKTGQKVTTSAAKATLPIITRRQPLKKKRRQTLTARLIVVCKLVFIILPLSLVLPTRLIDSLPLEFNIIAIVAATGAVASSLLMVLQYASARLLKVPVKQLW